jgi:phosphomannomutase
MSLIKSISGIRGTIGGKVGEGLSPLDAVKFTSAYAQFIRQRSGVARPKVVLGRDARISGDMVNHLVTGALMGCGIDVIDLGLSTTPTVEVAVATEKAQGGIILTASHNPKQWNALKLLNEKGEFISGSEGEEVLRLAESDDLTFANVDSLGSVTRIDDYIDRHIAMVLQLPLVDVESIRKRKYHVVIDCVNSTGGLALPKLLYALGVDKITELYCEPNGHFPHNPEPLPEHLAEISETIKRVKGHVGFVVDPDVDRLAMVCEDGEMFGEEYTLVAVADHVLSHKVGNTVSNLSSTRALRDVTEKVGGVYNASAVGEVNVVEMMKATNAVIGGEGNGGIILPDLHYGRDALVGIALFLTHMAKKGVTASRLRAMYPNYFISKNKVSLTPETDVDAILEAVKNKYIKQPVNTVDGVKIEFGKEWVHLRKSNTEPIIRIYCESENEATASNLANKIIADIREVMKSQVG